jgi:hypothetical protein
MALLNEREENLACHSAAALQHQEEVQDLKQKLTNEVAARERDKEESIRQMQELREELHLQVAPLLQVVNILYACLLSIFLLMLLALYIACRLTQEPPPIHNLQIAQLWA